MHDTSNTVFRDLAPVDFPFTIEMISAATGDVVWSVTVDVPGAITIPCRTELGGPVDVRLRFPDGRWVMTTHDGQESSHGYS
jgi:hypothetical protein